MKKILIILASILLVSGCGNNGKITDSLVYTTTYPIEYATYFMFKDYGDIRSIYPNGADISTYELSDKNKDLYSRADFFIYAGVTKEVNTAVSFLNLNSDLRIIDSTKGVNYNKDVAELWLDPSNYLMIARNIKSTLTDYQNNMYVQDKIERNYDDLKIKISELDVELTMMGRNATHKDILVSDDVFNYLSKYGINVISIDKDNENITKSYNDAKKLISDGNIKYIYVLKGFELTEDIEKFITEQKIEKLEINPMYTLTDDDRKENLDYLTIMNDNIKKYKTELFK